MTKWWKAAALAAVFGGLGSLPMTAGAQWWGPGYGGPGSGGSGFPGFGRGNSFGSMFGDMMREFDFDMSGSTNQRRSAGMGGYGDGYGRGHHGGYGPGYGYAPAYGHPGPGWGGYPGQGYGAPVYAPPPNYSPVPAPVGGQ
jgi:hypothetical protein